MDDCMFVSIYISNLEVSNTKVGTQMFVIVYF